MLLWRYFRITNRTRPSRRELKTVKVKGLELRRPPANRTSEHYCFCDYLGVSRQIKSQNQRVSWVLVRLTFVFTVFVVHLVLRLMHEALRVHLMLRHVVRVQGAPMMPQTEFHLKHNTSHCVIHLAWKKRLNLHNMIKKHGQTPVSNTHVQLT